MSIERATYSPDDNKLRMYPACRLEKDLYERVRAGGYIWAPKQQIFVAPMWTPGRYDLAVELAGEVEDEDTTLTERAEERADRFEDYSGKRKHEADRAHSAVAAIADNIPLGQPILVGHHSEKRARKDAERIQNGMRKAIDLWETSKYWQQRAAGAISHAKYKERPDVRHRRIKGIESDKRKAEKAITDSARDLRRWESIDQPDKFKMTKKDGTEATREERAAYIANTTRLDVGPGKDGQNRYSAYDVLGLPAEERYKNAPEFTIDEVIEKARRSNERVTAHYSRWIAHYDNRLAYERAMLQEAGGLAVENSPYPLVVGGKVLYGDVWCTILRINRAFGKINSVSVAGMKYGNKVPVERIKDYTPPSADDTKAAKQANKLPPLVNYDGGEGFAKITTDEYKRKAASGSGYTRVVPATETHGAHRQRQGFNGTTYKYQPFFLTDAKVIERPTTDPDAPTPKPRASIAPIIDDAERSKTLDRQIERRQTIDASANEGEKFDALKQSLKAGVQVVAAPQLFPTPAAIAERMADLAQLEPGLCVLEPSAGTGNLVRAVLDRVDTEVLAYEVNSGLCAKLSQTFPSYKLQVRCKDFLSVTDFQGRYPRVLMNPPFANAQDIAHIIHARKFLAPGGILVAICAAGPRQHAQLQPIADSWEELPAGTFEGTNVRTILLTMSAEDPEGDDTDDEQEEEPMTDPTPHVPTLPECAEVRAQEVPHPPIVDDWAVPFTLTPPSNRGALDAHQPSLLPAGVPQRLSR